MDRRYFQSGDTNVVVGCIPTFRKNHERKRKQNDWVNKEQYNIAIRKIYGKRRRQKYEKASQQHIHFSVIPSQIIIRDEH